MMSSEDRTAEASRIRSQYPDRVPIFCEKAPNEDLPDLARKKFLVPDTMIFGEFAYIVLKHLRSSTNEGSPSLPPIHLSVGCASPGLGAVMSVVYEDYKDDDGFLYLRYSREEFGENFPTMKTYLHGLLSDTDVADVAFKVGSETIAAHRLVLMRIPYFKHLLCDSFFEGCAAHVQAAGTDGARATPVALQHVDAATLHRVLRFIYTDNPGFATEDLGVGAAMDLGRAADMYCLARLRHAANCALKRHLENAQPYEYDELVDMMQYAKQSNCRALLEVVFEHIQQHFAQVALTARFRELAKTDMDLYKQIVDAVGSTSAAAVATRKRKSPDSS